MTIIETIRAEIERLKGQLIRGACAAQIEMETNCKEEAYDEVLAILDTLEEQPVELEEEIENYFNNWSENSDTAEFDDEGYKINIRGLKNIARHFYELGRKSKGVEWTEKDIENGSYISAFLQANCGNNVILKEATMWFMSRLRQLPIQQSKVQPVCEDLKKRVSEIYPNKEGDLYSLHSTLQRGGYIRGYQDCKDEMMKKAVEGTYSTGHFSSPCIYVPQQDLKIETPVGVIIVKED